jgi:hypothetical protein
VQCARPPSYSRGSCSSRQACGLRHAHSAFALSGFRTGGAVDSLLPCCAGVQVMRMYELGGTPFLLTFSPSLPSSSSTPTISVSARASGSITSSHQSMLCRRSVRTPAARRGCLLPSGTKKRVCPPPGRATSLAMVERSR